MEKKNKKPIDPRGKTVCIMTFNQFYLACTLLCIPGGDKKKDKICPLRFECSGVCINCREKLMEYFKQHRFGENDAFEHVYQYDTYSPKYGHCDCYDFVDMTDPKEV